MGLGRKDRLEEDFWTPAAIGARPIGENGVQTLEKQFSTGKPRINNNLHGWVVRRAVRSAPPTWAVHPGKGRSSTKQ